MSLLTGIFLALLTTLPLAWKWQLGMRRVAIAVVVIGLAASGLVYLLDPHAFVVRAIVVCALTQVGAAGLLLFRFYRDPERVPPDSPDVVVSPADGVVVYVRKSRQGVLPVVTKKGTSYSLKELTRTPLAAAESVVVGISMSFLDVHVNRAPINGRVSAMHHSRGLFGSLRNPEMVFENERATTLIERPGFQVAVVQIASRLVRQIAVFLSEGQEVALGQKLGVIRLGSQVDLVLPARPDMRVAVREGDRVRAGESIIAVIDEDCAEDGACAELPASRPGGAVVIGGDYRGLCIERSLGRRGIPVWIAQGRGEVLAGSSRYCSRVLTWPRDEADQVALLLHLAENSGIEGWALFPTTDETAAFLARHHEALGRHFALTTPRWEVMRWAYDKRLTYECARHAGVPTPLTFYPFGPADVAGYDLEFPVILKPAVKDRDNRLTRDKAWRVDDRESLLRRYQEACELIPPEYVMIQELIPGGGEAQFSFAALCVEGRVLACLTARRTRQYPPEFGHSSSFVETVELPEVERAARRVLEDIRYSGLVEVEFKYDSREDAYKLLDVNPRAWTWHTLGARAGVDFPWLLWQLACGEPVPQLRGRPGVKWVRTGSDVSSALSGILRGELTVRDYLRTYRGPVELAILSADDVLPALLETPAVILSKAARALRSKGA